MIKAHGLDKAANLDIETIELASTDAAKVALMGVLIWSLRTGFGRRANER